MGIVSIHIMSYNWQKHILLLPKNEAIYLRKCMKHHNPDFFRGALYTVFATQKWEIDDVSHIRRVGYSTVL